MSAVSPFNKPVEALSYPESKVIAELAQQAVAPKAHPHPDGLPFVVLDGPDGQTVETLYPQERPTRHKGAVKLRDAKSFIIYVMNAQVDASNYKRIYATLEPAAFVAVLNDHGVEPGYRDWRATFAVPASREWLLWNNANRKQMGQLAFAEFVEDNLPDIVRPDGASMLEMALNFEASRNSAFKSVQRLQDGSVNFAYVDEADGAGTVRMPAEFVIRIPVFERNEPREATARLKYRVGDGKLTIWYELVRPHKVLEAAFIEVWDAIVKGTGQEILLGTPE